MNLGENPTEKRKKTRKTVMRIIPHATCNFRDQGPQKFP